MPAVVGIIAACEPVGSPMGGLKTSVKKTGLQHATAICLAFGSLNKFIEQINKHNKVINNKV